MIDIKYEHPGGRTERVRKTSPVQTKAGALHYERQVRQALQDGTLKGEAAPAPTLEGIMDEFLAYCRTELHKAGGIETKESAFRAHLLPLFGSRRIDSFIAKDQLELRKRFEGKSRSTHNNSATVLNSLLKFAVLIEVIPQVPHKVRLYKRIDKTRGFYDFDEFEWLVGAATKISTTAALAVLLGGEAGLRRGEIYALRWQDCDLRRGLLTIEWAEVVVKKKRELNDTKGLLTRTIPMTQRLLSALKKHRHLRGERVLYDHEGRPFTDHVFRDLLERVRKLANLPNRGSSHVLRHTHGSHLAALGAPVTTIKELMGHRELTTTMKYMHLAKGETARAIALLDDRSSHLEGQPGGNQVARLTNRA